MKSMTLGLVFSAMAGASALGQDSPPPPVVNPPGAPRAIAGDGLSAEQAQQVERMIERTVERVLARQAQATAAAMPSQPPTSYAAPQPPYAAPQGVYAAPQGVYAASQGVYAAPQAAPVATTLYANVLVPPGPCKRMLGRFGDRLARLSAPKARVLAVVPAEAVVATTRNVARPAAVLAEPQSLYATAQSPAPPFAPLALPTKRPPSK